MKPHKLFDSVIERMGIKNDRALAALIGVDPAKISSLRHGRFPVCSMTILRIHTNTNIPVRELKEWAGLPCMARIV